MKKLLLILLLCSGCYGTYYTTDVNRRVYYPKPTYYKPYIYKPTANIVIRPNKVYPTKKPNKIHKPYKKPHYKKK